MEIQQIPGTVAREVVEQEHYAHCKPPVSYAYGLYESTDLVGVVTFGVPASRHLMHGVCPANPDWVIELNRLWVSDTMPRNTESWFVARALNTLPALIVVSYADTSDEVKRADNSYAEKTPHMGYIYRALNFNYAGWTDMERKSPRVDYIAAAGGHTRNAFRNGAQPLKAVPRRPKVRYWTVTGNRTERRFLTQICQWPSLDWKAEPPPTTHTQRKPLEGQ